MSYKNYTVDRIEENIAVLYDDEDIKKEIPVLELPAGLKEGDILVFDEENKTYFIDKEKTEQTKAAIRESFMSKFKK